MPALKRKPKAKSPQAQAGRSSGGASGGVQGVNVIILVLVAVSVVIAAGLLAKTVNTARAIDEKATNIRDTGIGINNSTDAIRQLVETNKIATSILESAEPLEPALTKIVARARSINTSAASIDSLASTILSTAGTINTSATTIGGSGGDINATAGDINETAKAIDSVAGGINDVAGTINRTAGTINGTVGAGSGILGIARIIDRDAANIVTNLNSTIGIAEAVKVDSGNILGEATEALDNAACIDAKLPGTNAGNNCAGKP